jgi:hypothetical protein
MQINIRPSTSGSGTAYTTFADDLNLTSPRTNPDQIDYRPPTLRTLEQIQPLAGGSSQFVANRGNALWNMQIPIRMWYASEIAARQAIPALAAALNLGLIDVQILDTASTDAVYLTGCSLGEFTPDTRDGQSGVCLSFTLKLTGPNFNNIAP